MWICKGLTLTLLICSFGLSANDQPTLRFYSEIAAPYYWLDDEGQPRGASFDIASALIKEIQVKATIEHLPWARAFHQAVNEPNVVLVSALRTANREKLLQWLGKVHGVRASMIRLNRNQHISVDSVEQAKQFVVGTVRGYGSANYLLEQGFVEGENLVLVGSTGQLWTMLYLGRIDLVLSNQQSGYYEIESAGYDPSVIEAIFNVQALDIELQMATGHMTSSSVAKQIRSGLQALKERGELQRIMDKWNLQ